MKAPRVLFVSHSRQISGAEIVLLEVVKRWNGASAFVFEPGPLADALAASGLSVQTSGFASGISELKRDRPLWRILPLAGRILAITWAIIRAARRHDVVYANSQKAFALAAIATAVARRPILWHLHDIPDRHHFGRIQLWLQVTLANARASCVIVPSIAVAEGFIAAGGKRSLVRVVANGVAVPTSDGRTRETIRLDLGLPDGPLVGVFSRLAEWKGQHVLIDALVALPDVRCIIVGSALFGEDTYADALKRQVTRLGLEQRVTFLGQRADVGDLLRAVDVMVHPSTSPEPFGLTVVESMFAGTPVVGTAIGAVPDILEDGQAGTLVPPGDAEALAEAIRPLLSPSSEVRRRTAYARQRADRRYTARQMVCGIVNLVQDVAAETSL